MTERYAYVIYNTEFFWDEETGVAIVNPLTIAEVSLRFNEALRRSMALIKDPI